MVRLPATGIEVDSLILPALESLLRARADLTALEEAPPTSSRWKEATPYQSQLALARRQVAVAELALRSARLRALNVRLEKLRGARRATVTADLQPVPGELFTLPPRPFPQPHV
jgi:hypothetical protein